MTAREGPLLRAVGVSRSFGRAVALHPVDLDLVAGQTVALIGPNGAGKSTLLSVLGGALPPSGGRVVSDRHRPRVGWVPQQPALYGRLTARENLELFARLEGAADPAGAAQRLLELVELSSDRLVADHLSGGNQQRLNIAIALIEPPDVLLLDEPTAALDPRQRRRVWEVVDSVRARGGAVVFVTQNLEEVSEHADRVVVLEAGRLVFDGSSAEYEQAGGEGVFA